jgi:predicted tellurium resistance membrane protein TerC
MISFQDLVIIMQLVVIEGILSIDNALALAAISKRYFAHDRQAQKKALIYGLWGAYIFR